MSKDTLSAPMVVAIVQAVIFEFTEFAYVTISVIISPAVLFRVKVLSPQLVNIVFVRILPSPIHDILISSP